MNLLKEQVGHLVPVNLQSKIFAEKIPKSEPIVAQVPFKFLGMLRNRLNFWHYLIIAVGLLFSIDAFTQEDETLRSPAFISGSVGITSNGISLVPNFSLEQPAAIFNMELEKGRFSFEPELTFSLEEGRPWYQLYWLRYKLADGQKFKFRTGAHLGLNFVKTLDADLEEIIQTERYLTGELETNYQLTKNISLGLYYLLSHGFDIDNSDPLHFLKFNASFSNLRISQTLFLEIVPELYYLSSFGEGEGYYFTSFFELTKVNFPLSLSSRINQAISTQIDGKEFLWNLTLTYTFRKGKISF